MHPKRQYLSLSLSSPSLSLSPFCSSFDYSLTPHSPNSSLLADPVVVLGEAGGVESAETFAASQLPIADGGNSVASLRGPGLGGEGRQLLPVPETAPPAPPLPTPLVPVAVVGSPLDVKLCVALSGRGYLDRCWFGVDMSSFFLSVILFSV